MKRFFTILFILALTAVFVLWCLGTYYAPKPATKSDLEAVRLKLKMQIDSVLRNQDSIKAELRAVRQNTDTLRAGQEVIFKSMKESLWQYIFP